MNEFVYKLTLDLNCAKTPPVICSGQFDKGRKFEFTITADGDSCDVNGCNALLKGVRSDGSHFAVDCTVTDNKIVKVIDETTLSVRGKTVAKLVISDADKSYSTQIFIIDVDSSLEGDVTVTDDYSILNRLMEQIYALNESGAVLVDDEINKISNNPIANKAVAASLEEKENLSNKVSTVDFQNASEDNYPSTAALYNYHNNYVAPCYVDIENLGKVKSDKATTLSGYGIKDAYTKEQSKNLFGLNVSVVFDENLNPLNYTEAASVSAGSFATGNKSVKTAFVAKNLTHIGGGAFANCTNLTDVYIDNPSESVTIDSGAIPSTAVIHYNSDFNDNKNLIISLINLNSQLSKKYDSSNIETGSGVLTVYTPAAVESNLVKSCTFRYQKTGNTANTFFSIVFNESSISYLQFTGLPFIAKNESDQNRHIAATNKQNQVIVYPVGSWLTLNFNGTKTFSQDETLNGVITMLVS